MKEDWKNLPKVLIAVLTDLAEAIGIAACIERFMKLKF